jgi:predicted enzyme related to lactoylglutathione lyase
MPLRLQALAFDCHDPDALAAFWAEALGWERGEADPGEACLVPPAGDPAAASGLELLFLPVPEGKQVKNRLHLDLSPDDRDAEVARLEALGARRVDVGQGDVSWIVLADPEGNELCVLRSRER